MKEFENGLQEKHLTGAHSLTNYPALMDREFVDVKFIDCVLEGGDFASSSFIRCEFENVKFSEAELMAVTFLDCSYRNICFIHCTGDFSLN